MTVSVIEQAKIQAQVLVPLVKALQAELGEVRANALVRSALADLYRRLSEEFWRGRTRAISARPSRRPSVPTPATMRSLTTSSSNRMMPSLSMSSAAPMPSSTRRWASRSWASC